MKKLFFLLLLISCISFQKLNAQTKWAFDTMHTNIGFSIAHMGISFIEGEFKSFNGTVSATKDDFSDATVDFTIKTSSISTDVAMRDNHLRSPDFFDVAKYPEIKFKGKIGSRIVGNTYMLNGDLTMHGVTKPINLKITYLGQVDDANNKIHKAGFMVEGKLKRDEFGITSFSMLLPTGAPMVGNEVKLNIGVELVKL